MRLMLCLSNWQTLLSGIELTCAFVHFLDCSKFADWLYFLGLFLKKEERVAADLIYFSLKIAATTITAIVNRFETWDDLKRIFGSWKKGPLYSRILLQSKFKISYQSFVYFVLWIFSTPKFLGNMWIWIYHADYLT